MPHGEDFGLTAASRTLLAPAFGASIALSFLAGWQFSGRPLTDRSMIAAILFLAAGTMSVAMALLAMRWLAEHPFGARFAAAFLCLLVGTAAIVSLSMTVRTVTLHHDVADIPIHVVLLILAVSGLSDFYSLLAIAAPMTLPLGLPVIVLFALLIARAPR